MTDGEVDETVTGITHFQGAEHVGAGARRLRAEDRQPVEDRTDDRPDDQRAHRDRVEPQHGPLDRDGRRRAARVRPQPGRRQAHRPTDDTFTYFSTLGAGNGDPEGVTYDPTRNRIWVADGVNQEIYQYTPAGTLVSHFDVEAYGALYPESVDYNPQTTTPCSCRATTATR